VSLANTLREKSLEVDNRTTAGRSLETTTTSQLNSTAITFTNERPPVTEASHRMTFGQWLASIFRCGRVERDDPTDQAQGQPTSTVLARRSEATVEVTQTYSSILDPSSEHSDAQSQATVDLAEHLERIRETRSEDADTSSIAETLVSEPILVSRSPIHMDVTSHFEATVVKTRWWDPRTRRVEPRDVVQLSYGNHPQHGLLATLESNGTLHVMLSEASGDALPSGLADRHDMFCSLMQRLHQDGLQVTTIKLRSSSTVACPDLEHFQLNIRSMSWPQAVRNTPSGRLAAAFGFTEIAPRPTRPSGSAPPMVFQFERPAAPVAPELRLPDVLAL